MDPPPQRKPLPLTKVPDLWSLVGALLETTGSESGSVATSNGFIGLRLYSDSAHLREFFSGNFGASGAGPRGGDEATIVALSRESVPEVPMLEPRKRYVDPERRLIVSFGSEYYGNIKVSVRGLCSSAMIRRREGGFLHGASMKVRGTGIVVSGVSGAGKTTITHALMSLCPGDVQIINDDWGWADQDSRSIVFTGEPRLHMKYRSVHAIAPHLHPSPELYTSENYAGDFNDPHARLLIRREEVFSAAVTNACSFDALVVVTRDQSRPISVRSLNLGDLDMLESAEYSAFYGRHERFMDGSLLLVDEEDLRHERERFAKLLSRIPGVLVNNVGSPDIVAMHLLTQLGL